MDSADRRSSSLVASEQARLVAALIRGGSLGTPAVIETHISYVLLTGSHAYKIKKAVDLGFLDFTTLSARKHFCDEELRLNRRLAPELYLGVVPICRDATGRHWVGRDGEVVDRHDADTAAYVTVRLLPADRARFERR